MVTWRNFVAFIVMQLIVNCPWLLLTSAHTDIAKYNYSKDNLPIVFIYTVVSAVCKHGLPGYIRSTLEQAVFSQPDAVVVLASNYAECGVIEDAVDKIHGLMKVDTTLIVSKRTLLYANASSGVLEHDHRGELWLMSALRFFQMEDVMRHLNFSELMHIEADNMIYGRYTSILPILRKHYPLAATPLTVHGSYVTASVFWVSNINALVEFNEYMMELILNTNKSFTKYLQWLRPFACCKKGSAGGVAPDENGNGIKPFAINEMTMLAYFHFKYPTKLKMLPVVPTYSGYIVRRPYSNVSPWSPGQSAVGPRTGNGIWDANSWGQYIGGTSNKKGRNKGFIDTSHITGQALKVTGCQIKMLCGNQSAFTSVDNEAAGSLSRNTNAQLSDANENISNSWIAINQTEAPISQQQELMRHQHRYRDSGSCWTAPFVRCGNQVNWTPLWNLHVHSKHTIDYRSEQCFCFFNDNEVEQTQLLILEESSDNNSSTQSVHKLANRSLV